MSRSDEKTFYQKLRRTVRIWAGGRESRGNRYVDLILAGPDLFMLLSRLSRDKRVSSANRIKLAGALAYFFNPFDLVPEGVLGPPGLVDDIALSAIVLHDVLETTDPVVVREHWEGSVDVLELVRDILAVADVMVGGPVWRALVEVARSFVPAR
ncbi:MAG TPA: DUF1232 domain-containing protein [Anaerolineae bacterium]|nr:DUF1232 domain-containing protein [Anaerolineae bacterium]